MGLSKKPYKGTRDFYPHLKRQQNYLFSQMNKVATSFGYEPYDGPLLESTELYRAKSGQELIDEQIYSFLDRGEREVAIRPEMTPTLARMIASVHRETAKPIRWFSIPNLYRYERPQKGRLREHWQFNCDIFGAPENKGEVEILLLLTEFLCSFGANEEHFEILINDRRFVDAVFNHALKVNKEQAYQLYKAIDKSKKIDNDGLKKLLKNCSLSKEQEEIFFSYLKLSSYEEIVHFCQQYNIENACQSFLNFLSLCSELELGKFMKYDPAIVRGLDYYTGVVFEVFDKNPDNRRAISGGGSYDNLLQIFGEPALSGVGFGMGDVTLTDFLETHQLLKDFSKPETHILITYQDEAAEKEALMIAKKLRRNFNVETYLEVVRPKKVFTLAEKKEIPFVAFIGEEELKNKQIQIKNLKTKESINFDLKNEQNIFNFLKG